MNGRAKIALEALATLNVTPHVSSRGRGVREEWCGYDVGAKYGLESAAWFEWGANVRGVFGRR